MLSQCELVQQPKQAVMSVRTRMSIQDLPQKVGLAYGKVMAYLGEVNQQPSGEPFAAYYNMDMADLDVEIGFLVANELPGTDEVRPNRLPEGPGAVCLFTGPYPELGQAYEELTAWVAQNGYEATGVSYEFYLNDPANTPPQELKTRLLFPLKVK